MFRIYFKKNDDIKYISHLDLVRTFNRLLIRSQLPVKYSEGFNPHINLTFALPLSVGITSENESCEISLNEVLPVNEIERALKSSAPNGIEIISVTEASSHSYKEIAKAEYEIYLESNKSSAEIKALMALNEIIVPKKSKKGIKDVDIKPLIYDLSVKEEKDAVVISLISAAGNTDNLNPSLIIKALEKYSDGFKSEYYSIKRKRLMTEKGETV